MIDKYNNAANIRKKILNTTKIKKKLLVSDKKKNFYLFNSNIILNFAE